MSSNNKILFLEFETLMSEIVMALEFFQAKKEPDAD